jgi:hypothetical protein
MSRAYRFYDFEAFLRNHSEASRSRQSGHEDRLRLDRGSRESLSIERQSRGRANTHEDNSDRFRSTYRHRNRQYSLRESEVKTLIEVGKFRVIQPTTSRGSVMVVITREWRAMFRIFAGKDLSSSAASRGTSLPRSKSLLDSKTPNGVAEVPLTSLAVEAFRNQLAISGPGPFLFPSELNPTGHQRTLNTAWQKTLRRAGVPYFRIYDLRSTCATRLSVGGVADEWVIRRLRQGDSHIFKKYSQMKLQIKREALEKINRRANEMALNPGMDSATAMTQ